jgi:hypothetical protein
MDVFVLPVTPERYELYCEPAPVAGGDESSPRSFIARQKRRIAELIRMAEQSQERRRDVPEEPRSWFGRQQDRMMAWVAERIAQQRLLWNLRGETQAILIHPEDLTGEQAVTLVCRELERDYLRHRRWLVVDFIAFLVTSIVLGPFFLLVPGVANLPAFYFGFRVVGHWFSLRGAKQGMHHVTWTAQASPALTELRGVIELEPSLREQRVLDIASRLRLAHLATFLDRIATAPASAS